MSMRRESRKEAGAPRCPSHFSELRVPSVNSQSLRRRARFILPTRIHVAARPARPSLCWPFPSLSGPSESIVDGQHCAAIRPPRSISGPYFSSLHAPHIARLWLPRRNDERARPCILCSAQRAVPPPVMSRSHGLIVIRAWRFPSRTNSDGPETTWTSSCGG